MLGARPYCRSHFAKWSVSLNPRSQLPLQCAPSYSVTTHFEKSVMAFKSLTMMVGRFFIGSTFFRYLT